MYEGLVNVQGSRLLVEVFPSHDVQMVPELEIGAPVGRVVQIDAEHWGRGDVHEAYNLGDFVVVALGRSVTIAGELAPKYDGLGADGIEAPGHGTLVVLDASAVLCKVVASLKLPELYAKL